MLDLYDDPNDDINDDKKTVYQNIKKIIKKFLLHFYNPIRALKWDIRIIYYFYAKFALLYVYNIKFSREDTFYKRDYCDLYNLFKIIIKHNPKKCVEVGSGYSTVIIAKALEINFKKDNIKPILYSLEQNNKYLETNNKYFKKNLSKEAFDFVKIIFSDLYFDEIYGQKVSLCKNFPYKDSFDT